MVRHRVVRFRQPDLLLPAFTVYHYGSGDDIPGADSGKADGIARTFAGVPLACVDRVFLKLTAGGSLPHWLAEPHTCPLLLDHRSGTALPAFPAPSGALSLLVGPEGGLAAKERAMARQAGFTAVRLGPRILRTETAPLATFNPATRRHTVITPNTGIRSVLTTSAPTAAPR